MNSWLQKVKVLLGGRKQPLSPEEEEERKEALKPPEEPEKSNGT
jgi:hypothetical protein